MFKKKKEDMIELSELQKRSVNLPHGRKFVPKDGLGFVDLTKKPKLPSQIKAEKMGSSTASQPATSFSFFDNPTTNSTLPSSSNSAVEESLRKISMQISDLDTKIYKMEQRIELLERKAGIDNSSSSGSGFNW